MEPVMRNWKFILTSFEAQGENVGSLSAETEGMIEIAKPFTHEEWLRLLLQDNEANSTVTPRP